MAVSAPVRAYYTKHIFLESGRDRIPKNFRPLDVPATGKSSVEGCAGGGKNILEVFLVGLDERIVELRASCGLCNPAMYAAADIVCEWGRGLAFPDVLAIDVTDPRALDPLFARLCTSVGSAADDRPEDAREKFQYCLVALQNAIRVHRGEPVPPLPKIAPPADGETPLSE
jgi:hypothetical protein